MRETTHSAPPPAAVEPITTLVAVAQVGIQLYSMSRSGGGIGGLLAAQTRMLAEISTQLRIVNQHLVQIYEAIEEVRWMVRALPRATALEIVRLSLLGQQLQVAQVLGQIAEEQPRLGRDHALQNAAPLVDRLAAVVNANAAQLQADASVTLCPALAAAWYAELQLWASQVNPNAARFRQVALGYRTIFRAWMDGQISPRLASLAGEAERVRAEAAEADTLGPRTRCYDARRPGTRERRIGGGKEGSPEVITYYTLSARDITMYSAALPIQNLLDTLRAELDQLEAVGVEIHPAYREMKPQSWNLAAASYYAEWEERAGLRDAAAARLNSNGCRLSEREMADWVERENRRWTVAKGQPSPLEALFASTVLFGHFQTISRDVLASVDGVLERLPPA